MSFLLNNYWSIILFYYCIISSCSSVNVESGHQPKDEVYFEHISPVEVGTLILKLENFQKELTANGKLSSSNRADLKFLGSGIIKQVLVSEGEQVKSGQLIALIDDKDIQLLVQQNKLDQKKAFLDYEDHLLRLGYQLQDTVGLAPETKSIARLRSGLSLTEISAKKIKQQLEDTKLKAPFKGHVANVKARPFNSSSTFEYVCTLVNNDALTVEFKVLEQELNYVQKSSTIRVEPFSLPDKIYKGRIQSINPIVDNSGMITIKAVVDNDGQLLDGMGVNVQVIQFVPQQLIVPKDAVLDRQDRKVVFTVKDDSLAQWNYVEIADENSTTYSIKSGLNVGDEVIYRGHFNLAHDRIVKRTK